MIKAQLSSSMADPLTFSAGTSELLTGVLMAGCGMLLVMVAMALIAKLLEVLEAGERKVSKAEAKRERVAAREAARIERENERWLMRANVAFDREVESGRREESDWENFKEERLNDDYDRQNRWEEREKGSKE